MTLFAHGVFWGSLLESACYWLYLCYFGIWMRGMLHGSFSPLDSWDPSLINFTAAFLVDYMWRKILAFGNIIDPAAGIIYAAQGDRGKAVKEGIPIALGSFLGCAAAYYIVDAVHPVPFATWLVEERSLLFCFLCELLFSTAHQMRNAYWFAVEQQLLDAKRDRQYRLVTRGATATASLITSALVTLSMPFTQGGAMLHSGYTLMAALAHKDVLMLVTLGSANLLAALIAGVHAAVEFRPCNVVEDEIAETPPALTSQGADFEGQKTAGGKRPRITIGNKKNV